MAASTTRDAVRVLVADDHPLTRLGIRKAIEEHRGGRRLRVVGTVSSGEEARAFIQEHLYDADRPDVVIMDVRMPPGLGGLDASRRIHEINERQKKSDGWGRIRVLVCTAFPDPTYLGALVEAHVDGFVLKTESAETLVEALLEVAAGPEEFVRRPRRLLDDLLTAPPEPEERDQLATLCSRIEALDQELRLVLAAAAAGCSDVEIAATACLGKRTVENRRRDLYRELRLDAIRGPYRMQRATYMLGLHDGFRGALPQLQSSQD